jgi:hypothetical protein
MASHGRNLSCSCSLYCRSLAEFGGFGSEGQRHYWHVGVDDAEKIWGMWPEVYRGVVDCRPE